MQDSTSLDRENLSQFLNRSCCSACVYVGSVQPLQLHPTVQRNVSGIR